MKTTEEIINAKKELRKKMLLKRMALNLNWKNNYDNEICGLIIRRISENNFRCIHAYIPFKEEINITPVLEYCLKQGIMVVCPKTLKARKLENRILQSMHELEVGIMKTLHPKKPEIYRGNYDCILVPGLAFDKYNFRLGYGGGYYDTFLSENKTAYTIGLFYPFQEVNQIPKESHDVALKKIITI